LPLLPEDVSFIHTGINSFIMEVPLVMIETVRVLDGFKIENFLAVEIQGGSLL